MLNCIAMELDGEVSVMLTGRGWMGKEGRERGGNGETYLGDPQL